MPTYTRGDVTINYHEFGSGYPVLAIPGGGPRSSLRFWQPTAKGPHPVDPTQDLAKDFRVIVPDLRNAGGSRGPLTATDGWHTHISDELGLLDHLGIKRCHIMGECIGGDLCLRLIKDAPERVSAAALLQTSGYSDEYPTLFWDNFNDWTKEVTANRPDLDPKVMAQVRENLYSPRFCFSVPREFIPTITTPLLVLYGNDEPHPHAISEEIVRKAKNVEGIEDWKSPHGSAAARQRLREFFKQHQPK